MTKDLQNMCESSHKLTLWKTSDLYEINLHSNKIIIILTMLWHGFPLPVTKEMAQILHFYDIHPIELAPVVSWFMKELNFLRGHFL